MKKILFFISLFVFGSLYNQNLQAQSLPPGTCGIVYTYDAAGNRTNRQYVCNNFTGPGEIESATASTADVIQVDVLYPNPTTGYFSVRLFKSLKKATVTITDMSGRIVLKKAESGSVLNYDLSKQSSGEYHLMINDGEHSVSMKIIKSK